VHLNKRMHIVDTATDLANMNTVLGSPCASVAPLTSPGAQPGASVSSLVEDAGGAGGARGARGARGTRGGRGARGRGARGSKARATVVEGSINSPSNAEASSSSSSSVPEKPNVYDSMELIHSSANACEDEQYTNDEKKLNEFLCKHPMLNLEATSQKTLQVVATIFQNHGMCSPPLLPVIGKSYDDKMLRPANRELGERDCICGSNCMCTFLARMRHGPDTDLAFVCVEYLLPEEQQTFKSTGTLPIRRKKCLLCSRYFTSYLYYKSRIDVTFKMENYSVTTQSFTNLVSCPVGDDERADIKEMSRTELEPLQSASAVLSKDGYKPSAMLFVDEEFHSSQGSRDGHMSPVAWQPVVKFVSSHYAFKKDSNGIPRIIQVGIGVDQAFGPAPEEEQAVLSGRASH